MLYDLKIPIFHLSQQSIFLLVIINFSHSNLATHFQPLNIESRRHIGKSSDSGSGDPSSNPGGGEKI